MQMLRYLNAPLRWRTSLLRCAVDLGWLMAPLVLSLPMLYSVLLLLATTHLLWAWRRRLQSWAKGARYGSGPPSRIYIEGLATGPPSTRTHTRCTPGYTSHV
jgi:hypothetical protein